MPNCTSVVLRVGEEHTIRLRGLGSAGYSWLWNVEGPGGVVDLSLGSATSPPRLEPGGPPPDTYDVVKLLTVSARAPGHVAIHLALRRVWETDEEPLDKLVLDVEVSA